MCLLAMRASKHCQVVRASVLSERIQNGCRSAFPRCCRFILCAGWPDVWHVQLCSECIPELALVIRIAQADHVHRFILSHNALSSLSCYNCGRTSLSQAYVCCVRLLQESCNYSNAVLLSLHLRPNLLFFKWCENCVTELDRRGRN